MKWINAGIKATLLFYCLPLFSLGQNAPSEYNINIQAADSLFQLKQYTASGRIYNQAFACWANKGWTNDRYNAARAWALAGYADSAYFNLMRLANNGHYTGYYKVLNEVNFGVLHKDTRWIQLLDSMKKNELSELGSYNIKLCILLDSITEVDQRYRNNLTRLRNHEEGNDTSSAKTLREEITLADRSNYIVVDSLYRVIAYPGYDKVGEQGSANFWLLIQHQDAHPQFQDSVLTAMKLQVDKNNASGQNYAYLFDRVKVNTGQLQKYGTQMQLNKDSTSFEPKPCVDPNNLNERRKSMGLSTIEEYTKIMNTHNFGQLHKKTAAQ